MNLRVLNSGGIGTVSGVLAALDWLIANKNSYNVRVVNMSLGTRAISSYEDDPLCNAVRKLVDSGVVVVAAAGNIGKDENGQKVYGGIHSPGNDPSVWLEGWWPVSAGIAAAIGRTDPELWWRAGSVPMLIIQPLNDAMASPETGRSTAAALGDRADYVERTIGAKKRKELRRQRNRLADTGTLKIESTTQAPLLDEFLGEARK